MHSYIMIIMKGGGHMGCPQVVVHVVVVGRS